MDRADARTGSAPAILEFGPWPNQELPGHLIDRWAPQPLLSARSPHRGCSPVKDFLSPRIKTLKAIRAKIRPEPVREPLSPLPKHYAPPTGDRSEKKTLGALRGLLYWTGPV